MSAISLKSITGITSITTPAGVDNQLTLHTNNTTERVKIDIAGNVHVNNQLAVTGVTTFASDTHIADSIVHTGDTNTKIRFPAEDQVSFETGGTNRLKLHYYASNHHVEVDASAHLSLANNGSNGRFIYMGDANASSTGYMHLQSGPGSQGMGGGIRLYSHANSTNAGGVYIGKSLNSSGAIIFGNGGMSPSTEYLRIDSSGQVGIGTDNPNMTLHVLSSSDDVVRFQSTNASNGPAITLDHIGGSPADNDIAGKIVFNAQDDAFNSTTYADIKCITSDVSNGTETAHLDFSTRGLGSFQPVFRINRRSTASAPSYTTDDADGVILDVYNTGNPYPRYMNLIAKSAGDTDSNIAFWTEAVGGSPTEKLRIDSSGRMIIGTVKTVNNAVWYDDITINNSNGSGNTGSAGIDLVSSDDSYGGIIFSDNSAYEQGYIKYVHNSNYDFMKFGTNSNDRWQLTKDGHWSPITNNVYDIGSNSLKVRNVSIAGTMTSGRATITGTTTAVRNSGVSTATGSIIYNSNLNALEVYNGSEWKAISAKASSFNVSYLVVGGGGGGGGYFRGGGGGAGALRTNMSGNAQGGGQSTAPAKSISIGTAYSIIIGAGGVGNYNANGSDGGTSTFDDIVSNGGGGGARYERNANTNTGNGCGGGGGGHTGTLRAGGAAGTYGYAGGNGSNSGSTQCGGGGGGAAAAGGNGGGGGTDGDGGAALTNTITGSTVAYAGGAGGGNYGGGNQTIGGGAGAPAGGVGSGGAPGQNASIPNRGSGGGGAGGSNVSGGTGSAGVIILRFPSTYTATVTGGVTSSTATVGTDTVLTITATDNSSQTVTFA